LINKEGWKFGLDSALKFYYRTFRSL